MIRVLVSQLFFSFGSEMLCLSQSCIWPFMKGRQWTRGCLILKSPQKLLNVFQMNILWIKGGPQELESWPPNKWDLLPSLSFRTQWPSGIDPLGVPSLSVVWLSHENNSRWDMVRIYFYPTCFQKNLRQLQSLLFFPCFLIMNLSVWLS